MNQQPGTRGPAVPPSLRQSQEGTGSHSIPLTPIPPPDPTLTTKRADLLPTVFVAFSVRGFLITGSPRCFCICEVVLPVPVFWYLGKAKGLVSPLLQLL